MSKKRNINKIKSKLELFKDNLRKEGIMDSKVFLFGSWAKGKQTESSDIDVCVISNKFVDSTRFDDNVKIKLYANKIDNNIEPVIFNNTDFENKYDTLVTEIKKYGILI